MKSGVADVFIDFGITGDLAKVMTFRSLYRLERRGLLRCAILGVAFDDWTDDELRAHARAAIEACGETIDEETFTRFAARLSYLAGDFADAGTPSSIAAIAVQRPSPESETRPAKSSRSGELASADAARSSSQEATTLPRRQTSVTSARLKSYW